MSSTESSNLSITDVNASSCSCCATTGTADATPTAESELTSEFLVDGMTCNHCVSSVTEELSALPGVDSVAVDLVAGGTSRVTVASVEPLNADAVRAAVEEAGYSLSGQA